MRLYHVTDRESAERIARAGGFVDSAVVHDDRELNEYGVDELEALEDVAVEERRRLGEPLQAP